MCQLAAKIKVNLKLKVKIKVVICMQNSSVKIRLFRFHANYMQNTYVNISIVYHMPHGQHIQKYTQHKTYKHED